MDKNNCTLRVGDVKDGKEPGNLYNLLVAATLEKAITYVFAESLIRDAEVPNTMSFVWLSRAFSCGRFVTRIPSTRRILNRSGWDGT